MTWIGNVRQPSAASPLLVEIGPGTFDKLSCGAGDNIFLSGPSFNNVTFRGSGRGRTVFKNIAANGAGCVLCGAIQAATANCHDLQFASLTADSTFWGAVWRDDAGGSVWIDVDVLGGRVGWYEVTAPPCDQTKMAEHYWYNSKIVARTPDGFAGNAYEASCSEDWFYGCELDVLADATTTGTFSDGFMGISVGGDPANGLQRKGEAWLFGTLVRIQANNISPSATVQAGIAGARVFETGTLHMYGGSIDVAVSGSNPSEVIGLHVRDGGFAHTPGTSFLVSGGLGVENGKTARLKGSGAMSPFIYPPGVTPPLANPANPASKYLAATVGSDMFVETDCNGTGTCNGSGTETHLMISNPVKCGADNPWFNATKGKCRSTP